VAARTKGPDQVSCEDTRRSLSAQDGLIRRALRRREVRAHLRGCEDCRAFDDAIAERSEYLQLLAPPIPAPTAAAILEGVIGGGGGAGVGRP
jgi:predicted anti-sigma-YlaC factor YlaD